ncbi:hypothetical protein C8A00DRAFT_37317 [Chaetomidium leptoderma]|uniref:AAA+ ATPase domain-containing protein n=1 Tax=Chaetomidium leptoderma TaxID=669021 RepID=A0AAN6ZU17_9PEZI|nr:hypothetical protein C8A00DRAFT_37317 [Chaetomidium leptoderma]
MDSDPPSPESVSPPESPRLGAAADVLWTTPREKLPEPETWVSKRRNKPLLVHVEWLDFQHFKNRYSPDDGFAIIEVLRGHANIALEVKLEEKMRSKSRRGWEAVSPNEWATVDADESWLQRVRIQSPHLITLLSRLAGYRDNWITDTPRVFFPPFRAFYYLLPKMRECCRILEARWAGVDTAAAQDDADSQTNLTKPGAARQGEAQDDENEHDSAVSSSTSSGPGDDVLAENTGPMDPAHAVSGDLMDLPIGAVALSHVQKYIEFVEEHIAPRWNDAAGITKRKVRFNDLWMSFKPGELLYIPSELESSENATTTTGKSRVKKNVSQTAWKLYSMVLSSVKDDTPNDIYVEKKGSTREQKRCLDLHCYYIDYDGTSYVPVRNMFCISDYEGEKDITSLGFYPLRFAKDAHKITTELTQDGAWFCKAIQLKHLRYDGWTLPYGPAADNSSSHSRDSPPPLPPAPVEHVDGDIMIDFVEGFKSEPVVGPDPSLWPLGNREFSDSDWPVGDDNMYLRHWEQPVRGRCKHLGDIKEKTQRGEWYCEKMGNEQLEPSAVLQAHKAGNIIKKLDKDDLVLLPRRVVGYSFRERKFVMLDIRFLQPLPTLQDAFRDLKIDHEHKRMIKSLVKTHLKKQARQKQQPAVRSSSGQDLIRGKGAGLFILLHGVPGVGKTATAEAVAQASKKPLFPITCGDLGVSPQDVDSALSGIFRLAHHWDCVLLLDEADVFLSRRELGDLERNALVSVFLRVLEYYSGILFLTTNRVGTLDEAFKSRIHLSLYYPPLTLERTLAIFEVNLRKLREIDAENIRLAADAGVFNRRRLFIDEGSIFDYAEWHFKNYDPEDQWNGRQIRNAFQIAYSLAHFDMEKTSIDQWEDEDDEDDEGDGDGDDTDTNPNNSEPKKELRLDYRQFQMVAHAIKKFEDYLYLTTGATDKDKAATKHTRADDFDHDQWEHKHVYRRSQPPRTSRTSHPRPSYVPPDRSGGGGPSQPPPPCRSPQYKPPQQAQRRDSNNNNPAPPRQRKRPPPPKHGLLTVPGSSSGPATPRRPISPQSRTSPARPRYTSTSSSQQPSPRGMVTDTRGGGSHSKGGGLYPPAEEEEGAIDEEEEEVGEYGEYGDEGYGYEEGEEGGYEDEDGEEGDGGCFDGIGSGGGGRYTKARW